MKIQKLIAVINDPTTSIFNALQSYNVPWKSLSINQQLDTDYMFNRSGNKITSPLVDFFINATTHKIETAGLTALANVIYTKYGIKWTKEYNTLSLQYDPISNYDMTERMTNDITTHQFGHTNTRTDNLSQSTNNTRTDNLSETIEDKKAGFNSSSYSPVDQTTKSNSGTQTNGETKTNTGTQADVESGTNTDTRNYLLTRQGNVGVTTSQQMIESERNLWLWDFFDSVVYPDIDKILTIQTYN